MAEKHTATPWRRFGGMIDGYGIVDANGKVVIEQAALNGLNEYGDTILRAVNVHDALVDALKEVNKAICNGDLTWNHKRYADSDPYHPANVKLCAALELAEEQ